MIYFGSIVALSLLLGVGSIVMLQEKIIFPGSELDANHRYINVPHLIEKNIDVDGATINALHYQRPDPRGLIFFLHGNAGNLDSWLPDVDFYERENYDLFMMDYRGYGKSGDRIRSQAQLEADVVAAWHSVANHYHDRDLPIVIYGRSLGTYLATQLSLQVDSDLLVLVSPYTSMRAMAKLKFPFVPASLLRYPLATDEIITQVETPIVMLHGSHDTLIPADHAHALQKIVPSAALTIVEGAGHADIHSHRHYIQTLINALP